MAQMKRTRSYVNQKVGSKGLNIYDPARSIGEFQLRTATNMRPTAGGSKQMYGYSLFSSNDARTGGISMLKGYRKSDGTTKQIIFSNDDDYFYLTPSSTPVSSWNAIGSMGTAVEAPTGFVYKDFCIFGTGKAGNTPKKWNGAAFTNVTTPPAALTDVLFFEKFQGQDFAALFAAGDPTNPSRLYWSDTNDPDKWSGGAAGYIDIAKDDGYKITGIKAQGTQLIVYKENAKYFVTTFYESATDTYGLKVSPYVDTSGGSVSNGSIQVMPDGDIVSMGGKYVGVQAISRNNSPSGDYLPKEISRDIRPIFENINWSKGNLIRSIVFDNMIFVSIPYGRSQTTCNYVLIFDPESGWAVLPDVYVGCWEVFEDEDGNPALYSGDSQAPKIYKWSKTLNTYNGDIIQGRARTGKINMGSIIDQEDFEILSLEGYMQEGDVLRLKVILDGVQQEFLIDRTFIVSVSNEGGYLADDYLAEEYVAGSGAEFDETEDIRWLAILLVPVSQRKGRELEVELENENVGAKWGWNHLSANEITFDEAKGLPVRHILNNFA